MSMQQSVAIVLGILMVAMAIQALDYDIENSVKDLVSRRKYLKFMKKLVEDMDNQISRLHRRSCVIHLPGMDCDYDNINGNGKDENLWSEWDTPGKKKRTCDVRMGNPEGCLSKLVDGDSKDSQNWGRPDGPGFHLCHCNQPNLLLQMTLILLISTLIKY